MIKKIFCVIIIVFLFETVTFAEETDIYKEQLEKSGAAELQEAVPNDVREYLDENEIDIFDSNWVNNLKSENVFSHILLFLKSGAKKPLIALGGIIAVILINAFLSGTENSSAKTVIIYAATLSVTAIIITPIISTINTSVNALKSCAVFITSFVPVFAAIITASGKTATGVAMSGLLLAAANGVSLIANFAVVPLIGGYLSLSISTGISPLVNNNGISQAIKKLSIWIISFVSTVFLGILSIQTVINSHTDNLSMRTAKFIIGTSVPVAGGVLSEALGTLTASVSLLKSSVGIYGVVICCLIFLPIITELLLWRFAIWISDFISQSFELGKISGLLQSVDTVLSVLSGIILLTCAMFIISLSVVMGAGNI